MAVRDRRNPNRSVSRSLSRRSRIVPASLGLLGDRFNQNARRDPERTMLTNILTALFVLFLVAAVPLLSYGTASPSRIRLIPRSALYVSAVLSQLLLIAVGAVVAWATRVTPSRAGLHPLSPATFLNWTVGLTLVSFA